MARSRYWKDPVKVRLEVDGDRVTSRWSQPGLKEIVAENYRRQVDPAVCRRKSDFMQHVASVPVGVRELWRKEGREDLLRGDRRAMERYLNTSEGRAFRTTPRGRSRAFSRGGI